MYSVEKSKWVPDHYTIMDALCRYWCKTSGTWEQTWTAYTVEEVLEELRGLMGAVPQNKESPYSVEQKALVESILGGMSAAPTPYRAIVVALRTALKDMQAKSYEQGRARALAQCAENFQLSKVTTKDLLAELERRHA